ncbi:hypothetical protein B0A52_09727 [Exophiala mesophila]|uniref:Uncharacterized protein n=1 Tax=Exophiala mesophila TaxID=212818 RepID=A0A438MRN3_EXOME|nr:hypothetical protein B0A52_09727 [Exophiala mesophila]
MAESYGGGGLLSPPVSASSPALSAASVPQRNTRLPIPRVHPLRPGSAKEIALINYLDDKILRITRRYAKKFSNENQDMDNTPGYTTYDQFVSDVDPLVDIVWISGTLSMTEKVRIKSLIEETRVAAVNAASASGALSSFQDVSDMETYDEDSDTSLEPDDDQDTQDSGTLSIPLSLSRVYKKTLEILGDSLIDNTLPVDQNQSRPPL